MYRKIADFRIAKYLMDFSDSVQEFQVIVNPLVRQVFANALNAYFANDYLHCFPGDWTGNTWLCPI